MVVSDVSPLSPRLPSADSFIRGLEDSIRKRKRVPVTDLIRLASRGLAAVFPLATEPTLSGSLAKARGESVAEVHVRLAAPLLGLPGIGADLTKALTGDFERLALEGREKDLASIGSLIENQMTVLQSIGLKGLPAKLVLRSSVQTRNLRQLAKDVELNRAKARRIVEDD